MTIATTLDFIFFSRDVSRLYTRPIFCEVSYPKSWSDWPKVRSETVSDRDTGSCQKSRKDSNKGGDIIHFIILVLLPRVYYFWPPNLLNFVHFMDMYHMWVIYNGKQNKGPSLLQVTFSSFYSYSNRTRSLSYLYTKTFYYPLSEYT